MHVLINGDGRMDSICPPDIEPQEGWMVVEMPDDPTLVGPYEVYRYSDGKLVYDPTPEQRRAAMQMDVGGVIKALLAASPAMTVGIPDALAMRMLGYIPDYDEGTTYPMAALAMFDGTLKRRTIGGWREVNG